MCGRIQASKLAGDGSSCRGSVVTNWTSVHEDAGLFLDLLNFRHAFLLFFLSGGRPLWYNGFTWWVTSGGEALIAVSAKKWSNQGFLLFVRLFRNQLDPFSNDFAPARS